VSIERAQIDGIDGSASRAAHPQKPIPAVTAEPIVSENSIGIRLACRLFQRQSTARRRKDLGVGRPPRGRFLFGDLSALILHFAAIESHGVVLTAPPGFVLGAHAKSQSGARTI
jgi:hypothetical protein